MADIRPETQIKQIKEMLKVYKGMIKSKKVFFNTEEEIKEFFEESFKPEATSRELYEAGYLDALEVAIDGIETMLEREWD